MIITDRGFIWTKQNNSHLSRKRHCRWSALFTAFYSLDQCSFFQAPPPRQKSAKMTECNKAAQWHRTHQSRQCMTLIIGPPLGHNGKKVDMQKTRIIHPTFSHLNFSPSSSLFFVSFLSSMPNIFRLTKNICITGIICTTPCHTKECARHRCLKSDFMVFSCFLVHLVLIVSLWV